MFESVIHRSGNFACVDHALGRKLPFDVRAGRIALPLPCRNFAAQNLAITDPPIRALTK
jgi:hypothetical protein